jgi:hypothetical protein
VAAAGHKTEHRKHIRNTFTSSESLKPTAPPTTQEACKEYALKRKNTQNAWAGATQLQKRTSKHAQLQRRLTSTSAR